MTFKKYLLLGIGTFLAVVILFLPHYLKKRDSSQNGESSNAMEGSTKREHLKPHTYAPDDTRRKYALSQASVFFLSSLLFIRLSARYFELDSTLRFVYLVLGFIFLVWAFIVCAVAYTERPKGVIRAVEKLTEYAYGSISLIVFTASWILGLVAMVNAGMGLWYFYLFYAAGLIFVLLLVGHPIVSRQRLRHRRSGTVQNSQ